MITDINLQDQVKVVAIFIDEDRVKRAGPGENLRIRLSGVEEEDILSGFVLSSVGKLWLDIERCVMAEYLRKHFKLKSKFYRKEDDIENIVVLSISKK